MTKADKRHIWASEREIAERRVEQRREDAVVPIHIGYVVTPISPAEYEVILGMVTMLHNDRTAEVVWLSDQRGAFHARELLSDLVSHAHGSERQHVEDHDALQMGSLASALYNFQHRV